MPITDDQKQRIIDLHKQGLSRNDIARQAGVSAGTVTNVCKANDLTFDRSATKHATQAKVADNKARRASIVSRLYGRTESILGRLESDTYRYFVTTKEGTEMVEDADPPAAEERNHATAIGIYLDKAAALEKVDAAQASEPGVNMLSALAEALGVKDA